MKAEVSVGFWAGKEETSGCVVELVRPVYLSSVWEAAVTPGRAAGSTC